MRELVLIVRGFVLAVRENLNHVSFVIRKLHTLLKFIIQYPFTVSTVPCFVYRLSKPKCRCFTLQSFNAFLLYNIYMHVYMCEFLPYKL